jgi:hypothetical protein
MGCCFSFNKKNYRKKNKIVDFVEPLHYQNNVNVIEKTFTINDTEYTYFVEEEESNKSEELSLSGFDSNKNDKITEFINYVENF